MKTSNELDFLRLISVITHDAMTSAAPGYQALVAVAEQQAGDGTPSYLATFRYLHTNLSDLLIEASSDKS